MAKSDYTKTDLAGYLFNAKYPPNYETNGYTYHGYRTNAEETLFYDFAVLGYDLRIEYKGNTYYFLSEEDYVAQCDENFTEEFMKFEDGVAAIEQFEIEGRKLIDLIPELDYCEAV